MNNLKYKILNPKELKECTDVILDARTTIVKWSMHIYGELKPRRFRKDYLSGKLEKYKFTKTEKLKLEKIQAVELLLLEHNHRMCYNLASKYYKNNQYKLKGASLDDFLQEAYLGVIYGIYSWSGETKFSTWIYNLICNNLSNFVRTENPLSPPSDYIVEYGSKIQNYMAQKGVSFDQAFIDLNIPKDQMLNVIRITSQVHSQGETDVKHLYLSNISLDQDDEIEDYDLMKKALDNTDLTKIERAAFDQYMNKTKVDLTKKFFVTRQAIHAAMLRAKNKIRKKYLELAPSESINIKSA